MRASLLASATVALCARRVSTPRPQARSWSGGGRRLAASSTARAPWISSIRRYGSPRLLMAPAQAARVLPSRHTANPHGCCVVKGCDGSAPRGWRREPGGKRALGAAEDRGSTPSPTWWVLLRRRSKRR
jgi:hypothetical protein